MIAIFDSMLGGFITGASLILAIGAQNAFVLRQGLRQEHVLLVCLVCAVSDALLVAAGVFGLGALVERAPEFATWMRIGGALFLLAYGARSLHRAWTGSQALVAEEAKHAAGRREVLLTCLALTWLNPHVYLDTVVLLGTVASRDPSPTMFGAGAIVASFAFFFTLGFGARFVAPLFAAPRTWRILDVVIGLTMWAIAATLTVGFG